MFFTFVSLNSLFFNQTTFRKRAHVCVKITQKKSFLFWSNASIIPSFLFLFVGILHPKTKIYTSKQHVKSFGIMCTNVAVLFSRLQILALHMLQKMVLFVLNQ